MKSLSKRVAARLPSSIRQSIQRRWYTYRLRTGNFGHTEPEFKLMDDWVRPGDWVLDIGANVGIFTARLSSLVGASGRVIAFEPVPETFRFLVHNSRLFAHGNITLMNVAISSASQSAGMHIPVGKTGIPASGLASISTRENPTAGGVSILCIPLDQLVLPHRVSFVKMDVEGHELEAIRGMLGLIEKDRPRLLIEGADAEVRDILVGRFRYRLEQIPGSPNSIFHP